MKHFDSSEDFLDSSEIRSVLNQFEESVKAGSPIFLPANQWINLVYYYQRLQAWNKASQALDLAIAQYPWQAELYSQKALQEKHHNNIPSAIDAIDQALQ